MSKKSCISEDHVWEALTYVYDPELEIDVVNLGLVYEVTVEGDTVEAVMTLTSMGCPAQDLIEQQVILHLGALPGVDVVRVSWTFDPPWNPSNITEEGRDYLAAMGYLSSTGRGPLRTSPRRAGTTWLAWGISRRADRWSLETCGCRSRRLAADV